MLRRYWVNAPSTLQDYHFMHGMKVLADLNQRETKNRVRAYLTQTNIVSLRVDPMYLSPGWDTSPTPNPLPLTL